MATLLEMTMSFRPGQPFDIDQHESATTGYGSATHVGDSVISTFGFLKESHFVKPR
jgi:hypothetical protein